MSVCINASHFLMLASDDGVEGRAQVFPGLIDARSQHGHHPGTPPLLPHFSLSIPYLQPDLFTRPSTDFDKRGSAGRPVTVMSNFVPLETFPDFQLHQYHVAFSPPVDSKEVSRERRGQCDAMIDFSLGR